MNEYILNQTEESFIDEKKIIEQIRSLGIDMISEAQSGHPGIVLGAAPIIYTLYAHHLNIDVNHPEYFNRDRFIMSAGHGSALLYATLHMAGFDVTLDDLKSFRKIDSKTPGHPEYGKTPGVDMTTGPLGQGIATAVGISMAETILRGRYPNMIDYYTYVLCGDGDLMEGISYEACSLAGTLKLNKLIVLYDSNNVCLDGKTSDTFTENISLRFMSQGWNVITVDDGEDYELIDKAIVEAKNCLDKPTLIEVKTRIGKYSEFEGTNKAHSSIPSEEDIEKIKEKMGIRNIPFAISQNRINEFRQFINERCDELHYKFMRKLQEESTEIQQELSIFMSQDKNIEMNEIFYELPEGKMESPRTTSSKILNYVVPNFPCLIGGSADAFGANKTYIENAGNYSFEGVTHKNIFYGVREHAMGAITNGFALCGFRPYASTFLAFSDYMKPTLRLASQMNLANIYIFTHDSISVGEDGPTHQPFEQLLTLRSLPGFDVFRPADVNEVIGSYKAIFEKKNGPSAIILSRNELPILDKTKVNEVEKGGYIVLDTMKTPSGIVISSGEEVHKIIEVAERLKTKGIEIRVVSMPNLTRFQEQDSEYKEKVLPVEIRKIVVEASSSFSWNGLIYNDKYLITQDTFGVSGAADDVYKKYGFDVDSLEEKIEKLLK